MNDLAGFLSFASAIGGSKNMLVPPADAEDARRGATSIPSEVTLARRAGKNVTFNQESGNSTDWYWEIEGSPQRIMHD